MTGGLASLGCGLLPASYRPALVSVWRHPFRGRTPAPQVAHQGRDGGDQVDLAQQSLGYGEGPAKTSLGREVSVAHGSHRDEAEIRVVAARPRFVRGKEGPGPEFSDALEDEGERQPEQHVEAPRRQYRERVDF